MERFVTDLSGMDLKGSFLVLNMDLDQPLRSDFNRLYSDLDRLSVSLSPHDMIFLWIDHPTISVVGYWGIYAHIN